VTRIRRYFDEVWSELRKVSWPTRDHVRDLTVLVFVISLVVGVYIAFWDVLFQNIIGFLAGAA
jgi:preprotein translocase subunit SecE